MSTPQPQQPQQQQINIADALGRANAHWNAGQIDQAEQICQRILAAWPGQSDALHLMGLMAHAYGNLDLAISHLQKACMAPRAPAIYSSNLAEMMRQKGMLAEGEEAARRSVAMDPTLVSGWNNLGILLQELGKYEESRGCLERVVALKPDWAEAHNNLANTCRRLGRFDLAEAEYRKALALKPDYAEAHSNLAFLLSSQGQFDAAATEAQRAIQINPRLTDAYLNLAEVEMSRRNYDGAIKVLDMLRAFAPHHPAGLAAYAKALNRIERNDNALNFARLAVTASPKSAEAHHTLAQVLQALGKTEEALQEYELAASLPGAVTEESLVGRATLLMEAGRKEESNAAFDEAIRRYPQSALILASRADAHKFKEGDPAFKMLEDFLAEGERKSLPDRIAVRFALSKAYMDIKDGKHAFANLDEGNRMKRGTFAYDSAATGKWMEHIASVFTPDLYKKLKNAGSPQNTSDLPVFVLGMPRSGTTLIEQIIASHPQVTGAGELSALRLAVDASGIFPDKVPAITAEIAQRTGADYLSRVKPLVQGQDIRLVDKMPGNFMYAGLIPLILPNARIIHSRRNAVDTCLSCYTKLFGGDQSFTYNQTELGEFYGYYEKLMAHLRTILPKDRFIEVDYENVVDDLEGQAKRMIDFVGLEWNDACLNFHDTPRVVRTASVNQVRQPIYKSSKGRWKACEQYLQPLLAALNKAGVSYK